MPDVTNSTPLLLANYIVAACQRKLTIGASNTGIDASNVFISATDIDQVIGHFGGRPLIVVIPGPVSLNAGEGAWPGGNLLRRQHYTLRVYQRFMLDRGGVDQQQIIQQTTGLLDFFEQIRQLFGLTFFANADGSNALLFEAMKYEGESGIETVDGERGIVARNFNYSCPYGVQLPNNVTLTLADVT